jgi:PAS domain S-box-containing protein
MVDIFKEDYRESGALAKTILQALEEMAIVSITDLNGDIIYANKKFVEISGYSQEELLGQNHRILKSHQQPDEIFDDLWRTLSSGKIWRGEIQNRAKNGRFYWVDSSIAPLFDEHGKVEKYVAVRFLITDRKELERETRVHLRELEKFKVALDGTSDHVVITDAKGVILYANASVERITGFSPKEIIGKKAGISELWGGMMDHEFYERMWHTIKFEKKAFSGDITNKRKNGSIYQAFSSISPILGKDGNVEFYVGIERDITKEKEIDKAKTEFVSLASHQLRTPLSAINWYTEMLLAGDAGEINDDQKAYLKEVAVGSHRMVDLVNALLNVSRLDLGTFIIEPQPVDVVSIARSVLGELHPQIMEKGIIMGERYDESFELFQADEKLLRIVFQNLLSNAVKYTPANGRVTFSIRALRKGAHFGGKDLQEDSLVCFAEDSGMGIPVEQQDRIFSKLFRADNARNSETEGTGLGLYIIKSIIDQSGGRIWFESKEDQGTTFYVTFPLSGMKAKDGSKQLD